MSEYSTLTKAKYNPQGTVKKQQENIFMDVRIQCKTQKPMPVIQCNPHPAFVPARYAAAARTYELGRNASVFKASSKPNSRPSKILRTSLIDDCNVPNPQGIVDTQAHHIVETHNRFGQQILAYMGIDSNSAANGVLLPTSEGDTTGNASIHVGRHTEEYTNCVNQALRRALQQIGFFDNLIIYRNTVLGTLNNIRTVLLTQNVPINNNVDPTLNPETMQSDTITAIFTRNGLI